MNLLLSVPDSVLGASNLSPEEAKAELLCDLAVGLYTRGDISAGRAAEIGGMKRMDFERPLCERAIVRNYSMEDLDQDLAWARAV